MTGRPANPNPTPALANTVPIGLGSDKLMAAALEQDPMRDSVEGDLADAVDLLSVSNGGGVKSKNISILDVIGEGDESNDDGPDTPAKVNPALDLKWSALQNVEYLTDGGDTWIHTAVIAGRPVVVKTLKPECLGSMTDF